jgi:hypothetical protein
MQQLCVHKSARYELAAEQAEVFVSIQAAVHKHSAILLPRLAWQTIPLLF